MEKNYYNSGKAVDPVKNKVIKKSLRYAKAFLQLKLLPAKSAAFGIF